MDHAFHCPFGHIAAGKYTFAWNDTFLECLTCHRVLRVICLGHTFYCYNEDSDLAALNGLLCQMPKWSLCDTEAFYQIEFIP